MKHKKPIYALLASIVAVCGALTAAGKFYKSDSKVTDTAALGYFNVNINTYAGQLKAVKLYAKIKGQSLKSENELKELLPDFKLPPRWSFNSEGEIEFEQNPYSKHFCKDAVNGDSKLFASRNVVCKDGKILVKGD